MSSYTVMIRSIRTSEIETTSTGVDWRMWVRFFRHDCVLLLRFCCLLLGFRKCFHSDRLRKVLIRFWMESCIDSIGAEEVVVVMGVQEF